MKATEDDHCVFLDHIEEGIGKNMQQYPSAVCVNRGEHLRVVSDQLCGLLNRLEKSRSKSRPSLGVPVDS